MSTPMNFEADPLGGQKLSSDCSVISAELAKARDNVATWTILGVMLLGD